MPETAKKCKRCEADFGPDDDARFGECKACRTGQGKGAPMPTMSAPVKIERPRAVKVTPVEVTRADEGPKTRYWCGVMTSSPFQYVIAGGFGFIKFQGKMDHEKDEEEPTYRGGRGEDLFLTDVQVKAICDGISHKIVRSIGQGKGSRHQIVSVGGKGFQPYPHDEPLGKHLYMIEVGENMPADWRLNDPEPMC